MKLARIISPSNLFFAAFLIMLFATLMSRPVIADHGFSQTRLIDDSLLTDADSMTVQEIQTWLESNGGDLLENYVDNVDMHNANDGCVVHKATGMTAAEIIHEAANFWGAERVNDCAGTDVEFWRDISGYTMETISPKALLVMLQKEQSLINASGGWSTDPNDYNNIPTSASNEYKLAWATGFGVPDTGGRNNKYKGFYRQVNWAAWQIRFNYERSQGNTAWDEVDHIYYSGPMIAGTFRRCATCTPETFDGYYPIDGSPILMENSSTAALYYYTPHTYPGYYGNYNFVTFYENWFEHTLLPLYSAAVLPSSTAATIIKGESAQVSAMFENLGETTWYDEASAWTAGQLPVRLATDSPINRSSQFGNSWTFGPTRAAEYFGAVFEADGTTLAADQHMAQPGQKVRFDFALTTNTSMASGVYTEQFIPVVEGLGPMDGGSASIAITLEDPVYQATPVSNSSYPTMVAGEIETVEFRYQNTGNVTWYDEVTAWPAGQNPVRLGTTYEDNRLSMFGRRWRFGPTRAAESFAAVYEADGSTLAGNQHMVQPGQVGVFRFDLISNFATAPGFYPEAFRPIVEGHGAMNQTGTWIGVTITSPQLDASPVSNSPYPSIAVGDTDTVEFRYRNNGNTPWYDEASAWPAGQYPVRLGTTYGDNRSSVFGSSWRFGPTRAAENFASVYESDDTTLAGNQHVVMPGQIAVFSFDMSADANPGFYPEAFRPIAEGYGAMNQTGTWIGVTVVSP